MFDSDLSLREVLGLTGNAAREAWLALRGDPSLPPSKFGTSSTRLFTPRLAFATWRGRRHLGRQVPIVNLFNRTPTPIEQGWSVRVTQVRDFRGKGLTYDSHNGTDFAVPPGTRVVAAAPGVVVATRSEYNRGGLKLYLDHGDGLMTSSNHLARALVGVGERVARGQPVALSGYSGIDALASFGAVAPHLHFNVYLGGVQVDPFAAPGETSLWQGENNQPHPARRCDADVLATSFDAAAVDALLQALHDRERRAVLGAIEDPWCRAWQLVIEANTYPTRFAAHEPARSLFRMATRVPRLTLPFSTGDFDGVAFADDVGLRA
ncbi:MAG: M23 family metallopeptidase [Deltaproteobacteria bacterium]|nr:M23 family metallopeptidase [Deltaproteobacteria bacterium]